MAAEGKAMGASKAALTRVLVSMRIVILLL